METWVTHERAGVACLVGGENESARAAVAVRDKLDILPTLLRTGPFDEPSKVLVGSDDLVPTATTSIRATFSGSPKVR